MTEIDSLRAIHKPKPESHQFCVKCWEIWPCPVARLVEEFEAVLRRIRTRHAVIDGQFDRSTVSEIDKALGGKP